MSLVETQQRYWDLTQEMEYQHRSFAKVRSQAGLCMIHACLFPRVTQLFILECLYPIGTALIRAGFSGTNGSMVSPAMVGFALSFGKQVPGDSLRYGAYFHYLGSWRRGMLKEFKKRGIGEPLLAS